MKTKVLFILIILATGSIFAQRGVRIAYIDMEYILENINEYQDANSQLSTKAHKWKSEIEQKKSAIEQMRKNLSAEKILLTKELAKEREEDIQVLEKEMTDYQQDRFGPQGDLVIQRNLLAKPVQDQVFNAVQDIVKNRKYDFVFDKSADVVMLYSNKRHDISDLVLRSINRTKKQNERNAKNNKKTNEKKKSVVEKKTDEKKKSVAGKTPTNKEKVAAAKNTGEKEKAADEEKTGDEEKAKKEENTKEVNPVIEAKKEVAKEEKDEKAAELAAKKQKKIDEREARKKAYEERKKKLLEEKEAKRKAKLEARKKKKDNNNKTGDTKENDNN